MTSDTEQNPQPTQKRYPLLSLIEHWIHRQVEKLSAADREALVSNIAQSASPGFDFFLLVILSGTIATLGLITDSAAVIIGAMLLAPLMSPIIAIGLATIMGNAAVMRESFSALLRGTLLAIFLSALVTLINAHLPFISLAVVPGEVMARVRPTPIDLLIALAGGVAAAYALTRASLSATLPGVAIATALMPPLCTVGFGLAMQRWDISLGALALFLTNAIAIIFASALVFLLRGFGTGFYLESRRSLPGPFLLSAISAGLVLVILSYTSVQFFMEARENRTVRDVIMSHVAGLPNAELSSLSIRGGDPNLDVVLTIRTITSLSYAEVVDLQNSIVADLHKPVSLKINQVIAERLDPLVPPTATSTASPGPSPTLTRTASPLPSATATPTEIPTITPSITPTSTPSPAPAVVFPAVLPAMKLYQEPGGPSIGTTHRNQEIVILGNEQEFAGLIWSQVQDTDGRIGWLPQVYLQTATPTTMIESTLIPQE